jgi:hypothetical protein
MSDPTPTRLWVIEPDPESDLDVELRAATASPKSLWAEHKDVDFFLPPALSTDWITYLDPGASDPARALRQYFGIDDKS